MSAVSVTFATPAVAGVSDNYLMTQLQGTFPNIGMVQTTSPTSKNALFDVSVTPAPTSAALKTAADAVTAPVSYLTAHLLPLPTLTWDIGSGSRRWNNLYGASLITISDGRLKEDVETLQIGRSVIDHLRPVTFRYRGRERTHLGFIAQEVREAFAAAEPGSDYAVWTRAELTPAEAAEHGLPEGSDDVQSIRVDQIVPALVRCCQEQDDLIVDLQLKVAAQAADIAYCYETIAAIQKAIRERPVPV